MKSSSYEKSYIGTSATTIRKKNTAPSSPQPRTIFAIELERREGNIADGECYFARVSE